MSLSAPHGVTHLYLLAIPPANAGADGAGSFLDTDLGKFLIYLCGAAGIVIAAVCVLRMVKAVSTGRAGEGFKVLIFGLLIAALLFDLNLTISGAKQMGGIVNNVFSSLSGGSAGTGGGHDKAN